MNYSKALSFTFDDEAWAKKVAVGGAISFVSWFAGLFFITGFFILGYYLALLRNVLNGHEPELPEWNDWGRLFVDGLLCGVILFVYLVLIGALTAIAIVALARDSALAGLEKGLLITAVSVAAVLMLHLFFNASLIKLAETDNFGSALNFTEVIRTLKISLADYLHLSIFSLVLHIILFLAGLGIFSPFTNFWGLMVQGHLFGQLARERQAKSVLVQSA